MKNSTLFSIETRFKDRFYCCLESLKGNFKFLLVFLLFMGSFTQGISAQGTLVPSCNLVGDLERCAVPVASDTSGDFPINIEVARSGAPSLGVNPLTGLSDGTYNNNFVYTFVSNSSGAFIRSYGPVLYSAGTNKTTQTLIVCPGTGTPEFNLQLNVTNTSSNPDTFCECSKSVSISKVAASATHTPILCYGSLSDVTVTGQYSDVGIYTYKLLPDGPTIGPTNLPAVFSGLAGSVDGITYTFNVLSAEGCLTTTSTTITQPADNPVILNCPQPGSISACQSTQAIQTAFNNWLNSFGYTGGTNPITVERFPLNPQLPALCGGSVDVTWTVDDYCGQPQSCTRTFTITPAPAVLVGQPENSTTGACSYANQAAADAAFAAWLAQFTVSGGCAPSGSYGQPTAPPYCGGSREVTYTVTDKCYQTSAVTRTFTITPAPAVLVGQPTNSTTGACSYADQAAADAAFAAWLAQFTVSGGCAPSGSYGQPTAPPYCGGSREVTYTVTDKCYQTSSVTRTFTITPAPAVLVGQPTNSTASACSYADQAAADAAFAAWLAQFTVSGGCSPRGSFGEGQVTAPPYCGGSREVTWTVTDKCYQTSAVTRTFTITPAPAVLVGQPTNSTASACSYADQVAADAAFALWLAQFTVTGGCDPQGSFGEGQPTAPPYCGGSREVTYTVTDKCYQTTSVTRTFTITPAPAVLVGQPTNSTASACSYADQAAADAAFALWLAQFTVTGGCDPLGSFGEGQPTAPPYCGGSREVTYTVTDKCYQTTSVTRTFTITPAPAVLVGQPTNSTASACSYADQAAADAAFAAWLAQFTVSGGCAPNGSYGQPTAPPYCGGSREVTYTVTDKCYQTSSVTRTFTITPAPAVLVGQPTNSSASACSYADQAAADAAFAAWLAQFTVSGGCAPSGSYGQPTAPPYCGGSREVTYTVTDKCYQTSSVTRTFTITPAPAVLVGQPTNSSASACSYADQAAADAAFALWLAQFTVTGGCDPQGSFGEGQPTAPPYCGGSREVTYTVTDKCYQTTSVTRTFTITPAPAVLVGQPTNSTASACSYADQAAADAAFAAWLAQFTVSGGCSPRGSFGEGQVTAPPYCGGSREVTYTVTDKCYQTSSVTRTFTITPAPAVLVGQPTNSSASACSYADQAAADAAFAAWLAQFTVSGGCAPSGSYGQPTAPPYCGGDREVTWTVTDKCYQTTSVTRTFTITPAPAVIVGQPANSSVPSGTYADQAAADAAFAAWLAQFTVSGGCAPSGSYGQPTAPPYCGGSREVTWTVTDKCYQTTSVTRTFTIVPGAPVIIGQPESSTTSACLYADQAAANAAFAAWLAQFTVSGGINPHGSFGEGTPAAPAYCGGSTEVTWTVTDNCYNATSAIRTFTITAPPAVVPHTPQSTSTSACSYADQAAADTAFAAWLAQFSVSGGCSPTGILTVSGSTNGGTPTAPVYCGGTTSVTYTISDKCIQNISITKTFVITPAPAVLVGQPTDSSASACSYADQAAADAAFAAWLAQFTATGGCDPHGSFGEGQPTAPPYCGGSREVTYTVTDKCYQTTSVTRTFTITPAPAVLVGQPTNSSASACSYADQAAADAAFALWLAQFTVTGGCDPHGSFGEGQPTAPPYCGGSREVTYTVTDKCYQTTSVTRTFTITPAPAVLVGQPTNSSASACSYADQAAADAAFALWLAQFTVTGGCDPHGSFGEGQPTAPPYCGGSREVTYTVTDKCYQTTSVTRTFTITPAPAVLVGQPTNSSASACSYADQAAADAAFALWLAQFTVTGGCDPHGSFGEGQPTAPPYCGGSREVTYTVTDKCYQTSSVTRTFTITPAPAVVVGQPTNSTTGACSYANQAAADTAFAAWLAQFTATGGCAPHGSFGEGQVTAPPYCGGSREVTWTVTDKCYQTTSVTRTFTITPVTEVTFHCGTDVTVPACSTQAQVNSAYAAFLASTTASGGCTNGTLTNNGGNAPSACGGYKDVTWTYTVTGCGTSQSCTKRFTVAAPAPVVLTCGSDVTLPACSTQAQLNAAWTAFLNSTTASGGCNGQLTRTTCSAPSLCGGYVDVTWTYTVSACGQESGCGNNGNSVHCTKRFTVAAPAPVVITCGNNVTLPACSTQAQLNTAWTAFLNSTTATGGCNGVLTRTSCSAPSLCGGYVDVTWTYTVSTCGQQSGCGSNSNSVSCTKRFTVAAPAPVVITCGSNVTLPACSTQAQLNAAWTAFLNSTTATGGCNGVLTRTSCSAPSLCGGYTDVTWTYTVSTCGQQSGCGSNSNSVSCTKRFTVAAPAPVVITCGNNVTLSACSTQAQLDAAWTAFLNSTTATGGCGGVLTNNGGSAPSLCGGYKDVTWTYTVGSCGTQSGCGSSNNVTCTKRFTVNAPSQVVFNCGTDKTVAACSTQAQINTAWNTFLASTTASGGCGGVLTNNAPAAAPSACGGYVDVTWTYTVASCGTQSGCGANNSLTCTKRFTVLGTTPVVFNCGTDVTVPACSTQAQVNTAWNAFLCSTTASGGCNGVFSRTSATTPSSCGGSVNVTWTYCSTACGGQSTTQSCTKTFTVAAPAPVVFNAGNNVTLPACSTQAQLNAAWTAFLNSTTATGGCGGVLTRSTCSAPSLCGGYTDVTWTYTVATCGQSSGCGSSNTTTQSQSITRRFTVAAPSPITFSAGNNVTVPACSTQAELNAAWNSFLASTTVTGGCGTTLTRTSCSAPALCGGYVDVTWTATTASCGQQSGCGSTSNSQSITRRFTVSAPSQVVFTCGNNVTVAANSTQAQITAAWNAFLCSTTASGGCNGTFSRTSAAMPTTCGSYADVTWTYTVGSCGQQSGCGSSNSLTCTKRFTIGGGSTAVTINAGSNVTVPSCKTQAQVNALWATFIASTTVSGGNGTLTNNSSSCSIPSACGGYADVTWTYTPGGCGQTVVTCGGQTTTTTNVYTVTRRFTVTAGGGVNVSGPANATYVNTSFSSQYAVNCAFANWLAQFTTVSSGCGSCAVFSGDCRVAPSWTSGGSVHVCYSITGNCNSDSVCATFTITRGATCKVTAEAKAPMTAKAYPNPFSETFNLDLTTSSTDKVGVAIYDMTGKLIEQREVNADEVSGLQVGDRFATGVYNVIVTQGNEVKTLRVIKR